MIELCMHELCIPGLYRVSTPVTVRKILGNVGGRKDHGELRDDTVSLRSEEFKPVINTCTV